jgi:hypothetical protein
MSLYGALVVISFSYFFLVIFALDVYAQVHGCFIRTNRFFLKVFYLKLMLDGVFVKKREFIHIYAL